MLGLSLAMLVPINAVDAEARRLGPLALDQHQIQVRSHGHNVGVLDIQVDDVTPFGGARHGAANSQRRAHVA